MTPKELMKEGFEHLSKTRECFEKAKGLYNDRGDNVNLHNVANALGFLAAAYDEVSAIWENDMNF
jgi:hypothetical protein